MKHPVLTKMLLISYYFTSTQGEGIVPGPSACSKIYHFLLKSSKASKALAMVNQLRIGRFGLWGPLLPQHS